MVRVNQIKALDAPKSGFRKVSAATPSGAWRRRTYLDFLKPTIGGTEGFEISEKVVEKQILKIYSPLLDTHIITRRCQGAESFPLGGQEEATES